MRIFANIVLRIICKNSLTKLESKFLSLQQLEEDIGHNCMYV
jgi:hypothetical protein